MPLPKGQMLLACIIMHSPFILFLKETPRVNIEFCSIWKWSYVISWLQFEPLVTSFEYLNVYVTHQIYTPHKIWLQQKAKKYKPTAAHVHKADQKFQIKNNTVQMVDFCTDKKEIVKQKSSSVSQKACKTEDKTQDPINKAILRVTKKYWVLTDELDAL